MSKKVNLFVSERLKEILLEIKDNSVVAKLLLQEDHDVDTLQEDHVNYIDISEVDKTKLSYLSKDRMKLLTSDQDPWHFCKKFFARPGSVINKIFKKSTDRDLELFNHLYRSVLTRLKFNFQIVSGKSISDYYLGERYRSQSGSLGNSCMKYDNCQRLLSLYSQNEGLISLLVMLDDDNRVMGRALLWTFDDKKIMDRIYTINDDELSYQFKKWANQNGYIYKFEQRWNNSISFESNGDKIDHLLGIKLNNHLFERYPYMDTFKFLDKNTGILYNYINSTDVRTLCAADGNQLEHDFLCQDSFTGLFFNRGEMIELKYVDDKLSKYPNRTNVYAHSQTVEWSRINDMYILKKDVIFDDEIDDFIFKIELDDLNNKLAIESRRKEAQERKKRHEIERAEYDRRKRELHAEQSRSVDWSSYLDFAPYHNTLRSRVSIERQSVSESREVENQTDQVINDIISEIPREQIMDRFRQELSYRARGVYDTISRVSERATLDPADPTNTAEPDEPTDYTWPPNPANPADPTNSTEMTISRGIVMGERAARIPIRRTRRPDRPNPTHNSLRDS